MNHNYSLFAEWVKNNCPKTFAHLFTDSFEGKKLSDDQVAFTADGLTLLAVCEGHLQVFRVNEKLKKITAEKDSPKELQEKLKHFIETEEKEITLVSEDYITSMRRLINHAAQENDLVLIKSRFLLYEEIFEGKKGVMFNFGK